MSRIVPFLAAAVLVGAPAYAQDRDAAGKVVGLDFSNPVFRNVKFTRTSDGSSGR